MITSFIAHLVLPHLLFNPYLWGLGVVVALVAGFYLAPKQTLAILTNVRTWVLAAIIAGVIGYVNLAQENAALTQKLAVAEASKLTSDDGHKAVEVKTEGQRDNAVQVGRLHTKAAAAPVGTKEDAVLDQITADDTPVVSEKPQASLAPTAGGTFDKLLDAIGTGS